MLLRITHVGVTQENLSWFSETFDLGLHRGCWGESKVIGLGVFMVQPGVVQASEVNSGAETTAKTENDWTEVWKYSQNCYIHLAWFNHMKLFSKFPLLLYFTDSIWLKSLQHEVTVPKKDNDKNSKTYIMFTETKSCVFQKDWRKNALKW